MITYLFQRYIQNSSPAFIFIFWMLLAGEIFWLLFVFFCLSKCLTLKAQTGNRYMFLFLCTQSFKAQLDKGACSSSVCLFSTFRSICSCPCWPWSSRSTQLVW